MLGINVDENYVKNYFKNEEISQLTINILKDIEWSSAYLSYDTIIDTLCYHLEYDLNKQYLIHNFINDITKDCSLQIYKNHILNIIKYHSINHLYKIIDNGL